MHELLVESAGYVIPWIEALGIVVVLWGIVEALLALSRRAWRAAAGHTALGDLGAIRLAMGEKMVLGLVFSLAGNRARSMPRRSGAGRIPAGRATRCSVALIQPLRPGTSCEPRTRKPRASTSSATFCTGCTTTARTSGCSRRIRAWCSNSEACLLDGRLAK